jgi:hypothetical protein
MIHRRPFDIANPKARRKILFSLVGAILFSCFVIPASLNIILISQVVAQPGPITPSPPGGSAGLPTIQITSVQDGMQVPPGELTIQGASSDTDDTDCQVFADVNDVSPMQNVTAAGESGDEEDFSIWTFTYTQDYQLITPGQNELTAKISCPPEGGSDLNPLPSGPATAADVPLNEWHTVNVTGVAGAPTATVSPPASDTDEADVAEGVAGEDEADGTDVSGEEGEESEEGEDGDGDIGSDIPSLFG